MYIIVSSMFIVKIYLMGIVILVGALILNFLAKFLGLPTWYNFVANPKLSPINILWLFVLYPFCLGLLVLIVKKLFP